MVLPASAPTTRRSFRTSLHPRSTVSQAILSIRLPPDNSPPHVASRRSVSYHVRSSDILLLKKLQRAQVPLCSLTPLHRPGPTTTPLLDLVAPCKDSTGRGAIGRVVSESSHYLFNICKLCWFYTYPFLSHIHGKERRCKHVGNGVGKRMNPILSR